MKPLALLIVGGLVVGLLVGFVLGQRSFNSGIGMFSDVLALGEFETLTSLEFKEAAEPQAKQALLDLIQFMDDMETNGRSAIQREIELDRSIVYMRLALLEEKTGNLSESKNYVARAQETLKKRDGSSMPEDKLRDLAAKFDRTPTYKLPGVLILSKNM